MLASGEDEAISLTPWQVQTGIACQSSVYNFEKILPFSLTYCRALRYKLKEASYLLPTLLLELGNCASLPLSNAHVNRRHSFSPQPNMQGLKEGGLWAGVDPSKPLG